MYPKVPAELLSRKPEGIILGKYKNRYVRFPLKDIYHACIIGGTGSGKSSTVLLDSLLCNFASGKNAFNCFVIDIKGELHEKATYALSEHVLVVDPADRSSFGWDVYYRLHNNPDDDLIIEAIEEIAQALIISTNPRDSFFVENARSMSAVRPALCATASPAPCSRPATTTGPSSRRPVSSPATRG